jgi:hypothetical protein
MELLISLELKDIITNENGIVSLKRIIWIYIISINTTLNYKFLYTIFLNLKIVFFKY